MDTASFQFVLFGLLVALLSNLRRSAAWRSGVMMAASVIFLALLEERAFPLVPLFGFVIIGYVALFMVRRRQAKHLNWVVLIVVFLFAWLKKYTFLPASIFLTGSYFTLGLSYILFRILHLLIEAPSAEEGKSPGFWQYLLYTLNFTTFVCGPIQRYEEFATEQFSSQPRELEIRTIGIQLERIIRGFFKVNVVAMFLHTYHDDALARLIAPITRNQRMFALAELAIIYPLFIYANFSGYIDIVIALARLMRVQLPENFDRPFSASSVMEFWNRWHMTLSTWFKTYVFNPMIFAFMRRITSIELEPFIGVFCFFVTFFLIGIWHGRTSEFVMFGILAGVGISVNKLWQVMLTRWRGRKGYTKMARNSLYIALGRGLTFSWFGFTSFCFWADWSQIRLISSSATAAQWAFIWVAIWIAASTVLALWEFSRGHLLAVRSAEGPLLTSRYALVVYSTAMALVAVVVTLLLNQPAPGIVYKAF